MSFKYSVELSEKNFRASESWRGFLAVVVFIAHIHQFFIMPLLGKGTIYHLLLSSLSDIAVGLFFFISGVMISHSAKTLFINDGQTALRKYFTNRALRIYPPYLVCVVVCYFIFFLFQLLTGVLNIEQNSMELFLPRDSIKIDAFNLLDIFLFKNSSLLNLNGPLWSLIVEVNLYVTFAFFFFWFNNKKKIYLLLFGLLFVFNNSSLISFANSPYILLWCIGSAYALCGRWIEKSTMSKLLLFISLVLSYMAFNWLTKFQYMVFANSNYWKINLLLISLIFCFIVLMVRIPLFENIGRQSYTLYILHFPLLLVGWLIIRNQYIQYPFLYLIYVLVVCGLIFLIAMASGKYLENRKWISKIIS